MNSKTINSHFSTERVFQLCKRYLAIKKRMIVLGGGIIIGLVLLQYVITVTFSPSPILEQNGVFSTMTVAFMLFSWAGYALTSTMFNEMNSAGDAAQFLTLPASSLEKLTSAWIVSYVCYTAVGLTALFILGLGIGADASGYFKFGTVMKLFSYTILQSIFLFGAVYFKANNFLSTIVSLMVFAISMSMLVYFLHYIGLSSEGWSLSQFLSIDKSNTTSELIKNLALTIGVSGFFIWMTLRTLKKKQVA
jgi:hypothetical protein